jgi:phosphoglycolate phosphatase
MEPFDGAVTDKRLRGPFHLLVFDWDGTLLDSISSIVECTQRALQELEQPPVPDEQIRDAIGLGLRQTVERFAPGCDEALFRAIVETYGRHWVETYCHRPRLFPGVRALLEELQKRGYLLGLATAKGRRGLTRDLEATGMSDTFLATRTVDEALSKPHPQMILDIADELGVTIDRTLMIGDAIHDLEMAHNARAAVVAVCSGSQSRAALEQARPLTCLDNVTQLAAWLSPRE